MSVSNLVAAAHEQLNFFRRSRDLRSFEVCGWPEDLKGLLLLQLERQPRVRERFGGRGGSIGSWCDGVGGTREVSTVTGWFEVAYDGDSAPVPGCEATTMIK